MYVVLNFLMLVSSHYCHEKMRHNMSYDNISFEKPTFENVWDEKTEFPNILHFQEMEGFPGNRPHFALDV